MDRSRPRGAFEEWLKEGSPVLEAGGIRLLALRLGATGPLQYSLLHTVLTDCNSDMVDHFIALSYVWGDANLSGDIRVDGHLISVTANLLDARYLLRHTTIASRPCADALCINQEDDREK
ncbi:hypothetical protein NHQ30_003176 [Ciborinia camelliae]|nr:hypothetical protein NHQ30_003176 [Ciborinia camelliae]